jgi:hypothetical protein
MVFTVSIGKSYSFVHCSNDDSLCMSGSSLQTACVRTPGCVAVVWDHSQLDYCWTLKAAAAPAVFNADKDMVIVEQSS